MDFTNGLIIGGIVGYIVGMSITVIVIFAGYSWSQRKKDVRYEGD